MHISLDGFVAEPNGEMNWIKVDEEILDRVDQLLLVKIDSSFIYKRS